MSATRKRPTLRFGTLTYQCGATLSRIEHYYSSHDTKISNFLYISFNPYRHLHLLWKLFFALLTNCTDHPLTSAICLSDNFSDSTEISTYRASTHSSRFDLHTFSTESSVISHTFPRMFSKKSLLLINKSRQLIVKTPKKSRQIN